MTFIERFDYVVTLLKASKRTCDGLIKGEKLWTVIGQPHVFFKADRAT
jgi:hypothetical protein